MAYFPDLTRYAYGRGDEIEGGDRDLNVGWLARGHDFTRGDAPAGLVDALLACATRPARLYRGMHTCDLCPAPGPGQPRITTMELDGRQVRLGNGEVRVQASDGLWYTAPTLVAHYVAAHAYLPPVPFVDAVLLHAGGIYVLRGAQLRRLFAMTIDDQREVCLRVLAALPTAEPEALVAACAKVRDGDHREDFPDELHALEQPVGLACFSSLRAFSRDDSVAETERRARIAHCLVTVLEMAADLGVDAAAF